MSTNGAKWTQPKDRYVGLVVLTLIVIKSATFSNITLCSLLQVDLRFGEIYNFHFQGRKVNRGGRSESEPGGKESLFTVVSWLAYSKKPKMETINFTETPVYFQRGYTALYCSIQSSTNVMSKKRTGREKVAECMNSAMGKNLGVHCCAVVDTPVLQRNGFFPCRITSQRVPNKNAVSLWQAVEVCETSRLPHFLDNRLKTTKEIVSLTWRQPFNPPGKFLAQKQTPWSESASELYRPSDRRNFWHMWIRN
jgi:hypothetical protein